MLIKIPYFIYSSGECRDNKIDYDIKFSSPNLPKNFYSYYASQIDRYQLPRGIIAVNQIVEGMTYAALKTDDHKWFFLFFSPYVDSQSQGRRPNCAVLGLVIDDSIITQNKISIQNFFGLVKEKKLFTLSFREEDRDEIYKNRPDYITIDFNNENLLHYEPWKSFIHIDGKIINIKSLDDLPTAIKKQKSNIFFYFALVLIILFTTHYFFQSGPSPEPVPPGPEPENASKIKFENEISYFGKAKDSFKYYTTINDINFNSSDDFKLFFKNNNTIIKLLNIFNDKDSLYISLNDYFLVLNQTDNNFFIKNNFFNEINDKVINIKLQYIISTEKWQLTFNIKSDIQFSDIINSNTIDCNDLKFDNSSTINYDQKFNDIGKIIFFSEKSDVGIFKAATLIKSNPSYILLVNKNKCLDNYNKIKKLKNLFEKSSNNKLFECNDQSFLNIITNNKKKKESIDLSNSDFINHIKDWINR